MMNPVYLERPVLKQLGRQLKKEHAVQLREFLEDDIFLAVKKQAEKVKLKQVGSPGDCAHGRARHAVAKQFFNTIQPIIEGVLGKKITFKTTAVLSFGHKDYSLMTSDKSKVVMLFDLEDLNEGDGGYTVLMEKESVGIPVVANSLTILTPKQWFVKYANCTIKKKRLILAATI